LSLCNEFFMIFAGAKLETELKLELDINPELFKVMVTLGDREDEEEEEEGFRLLLELMGWETKRRVDEGRSLYGCGCGGAGAGGG